LNVAELREKYRLKLLEVKILECCEERSDLSKVLSKHLDVKNKDRHELRMYELGLEVAMLWQEYRKIVSSKQERLDRYLD
jgi:hypothetical protein